MNLVGFLGKLLNFDWYDEFLKKIKVISDYKIIREFSSNIYFSNSSIKEIDEDFKNHDGYFTKLVSPENKVLGYLFRSTYKNYTINGITIPYLVTCIYQPANSKTPIKFIKTLGKSQSLKSGVRTLSAYIKSTHDYALEKLDLNVESIFPDYDKMLVYDSWYPEFAGMTKAEYNELTEYAKRFDNKVFKYYSDIEKEKIVKIWLKN